MNLVIAEKPSVAIDVYKRQNYIKGLFAIGLQGLFLMVCLGIYAVLVKTIQITDIHLSLIHISYKTYKSTEEIKSMNNEEIQVIYSNMKNYLSDKRTHTNY